VAKGAKLAVLGLKMPIFKPWKTLNHCILTSNTPDLSRN